MAPFPAAATAPEDAVNTPELEGDPVLLGVSVVVAVPKGGEPVAEAVRVRAGVDVEVRLPLPLPPLEEPVGG